MRVYFKFFVAAEMKNLIYAEYKIFTTFEILFYMSHAKLVKEI